MWQKDFECFEGAADIYVYFFERGLQLLKEGGYLAYISPNKYFRSGYGKKLREYLSTKTTIEQIIDFGDAPIFDAVTYPSIIIVRKSPPQKNKARIFTWNPVEQIENFSVVVASSNSVINQQELNVDGWQLSSPIILHLLEKLRKAGKPLREYVGSRFYWGIKTGFNEAFVVNKSVHDRLIAEHPSSADVLKPWLRGRDVKRWVVEQQDLWVIFTRHGMDISNYPAIEKHLNQYKKQLTPGGEGGRKPGTYKWYEIQDNVAYWHEFEQPKIIYPDIAARCQFAYDKSNYYPDATLFFIPGGSLYLLGILNSAVNKFFFPLICPTIRGGFMRFKSLYVEQIPIPFCSTPEDIETLVNKILLTKSKDAKADVSKLEHQIDLLVYDLYSLTQEEIKIVEG